VHRQGGIGELGLGRLEQALARALGLYDYLWSRRALGALLSSRRRAAFVVARPPGEVAS